MTERWSSKGKRSYPVRSGAPPALAYFEKDRPQAGRARLDLDLGGLSFALRGLDDALRAELAARWDGFVAERSLAAPDLTIDVVLDDVEHFIEPPESAEFNPVWIACDGTRLRYAGHVVAAWIDTASRTGRALLARGTYEPRAAGVENLLRGATAWCAAASGGALVHAASGVRAGKAYLFFGESGAGKSTLAAVDTRARFASDDLSLVLPGASGALDLVPSPFRGTLASEPVRGRHPLAAGFRLVQAESAEVVPAPRALLLGQLVANLPFVAETLGVRPDLFERIESAFAAVPLAHLRFRKDDSYWDAIERAGL